MADRIVVMNHGTIEQVGTPLEIYRSPASAFVADFVGTMNFVPAVVAGAGRVAIEGGTELASHSVDGLAPGTKVRACVRPEDVRIEGVDADTANAFDATITDMEFLGSFFRARLVPGSATGASILADFSANVVRGRGLVDGTKLRVAVPPEMLRVYPAADEAAP